MSEDQQLTLNEVAESNTGPKAAHIENSAFGNIPDDWKWEKTGENLKYIQSGISESQNKDGEGIPVSRIETIANGIVNYQKVGYVSGGKDYSKHRLEPGDLLFSNINSRAEIGKTAIYRGEQPLYHGMNLLRLRYDSNTFNPYFAYYIYDSPMAQDVFFRMSKAAVGQSSINQSQMERLFLPTPPLPEQRKIATVLYTVDQAIEKIDKIIEQKERIRTGLMQDVFTGADADSIKSVRLSAVDTEIPEHWEVKAVGDVSTQITDGAHLTPDRSEDGYLLLSARNVKNGYLDLSDVDYVPEEEYERLIQKCNPQPGDILISCSGTVGRVCEVPEDLQFALVRSAALVKFDNSILPSYAEKVLQSVGVQKQIKGYQTQSAQPNLFQGQIASLEIPIPTVEEQRDIAKKLGDVGNSIDSDQRYKSQLNRLKRGLMQDLLSGTVRTTDTNITVSDEVAQHG